MASDSLRIAYTPRSDSTSEQARELRARAWRFIFDCYEKKKGDSATAQDDAKGDEIDRVQQNIPEG